MHLSGIVESRQSQNSEGFCVLIQIQADFEDNRKLPGASITGRHDKKKKSSKAVEGTGTALECYLVIPRCFHLHLLAGATEPPSLKEKPEAQGS